MTQPPTASSRRRAGRVRALLLLLLLAEIVVVLALARSIGAGPTVLLLLATSVLGGWIVRKEGSRAWQALASAVASGRVPDDRVGDSAIVLAGGILLFVPGFITDLVGLVFVLPFTRRPARRVLGRAIQRRMVTLPSGVFLRGFPGAPDGRGGPNLARGDVIQGEVVEGPVVEGPVVEGQVVEGQVVDESDPPGGGRDEGGTESGDDGAGRTS
ncbi:FxsA family protein [Angustibacter sp. McL0619]|uniref:FxsA family protein n=1 Tax=Angustibacter sp. McL0619 TaxID=3415676 RepID=UPI003CEDFCFB